MPPVYGGRQTRTNPVVGLPWEYWKVTVTILFLDMIISEMNQILLLTEESTMNYVLLLQKL